MNPLAVGRPALSIADDPPHGVAGRNRTGADQLLALLQGDVGHLSWRGIDLVEGSLGEWKHLHGIDITGAARLNPGCGVCEIDTLARIARLGRRSSARQRLELTRQRQRLRQLDHLDGLGRICLQDGRLLVIVADQWRLERRAASQRCGHEQHERERLRAHQPSSFDQLMAWTNTPRGFFRSRSASCGVSKTTVRMAVDRSVAARLALS